MADNPQAPTRTPTMTDNLEELERRYLIRKQGAWYRPNCCGYTESAIQAGRYTLAEAEQYTHPNGPDGPRDGMDYVHENDVADPDWIAYRDAIATAREVEGLRAALQQIQQKVEDTAYCVQADTLKTPFTDALNDIHEIARAALEGKGG